MKPLRIRPVAIAFMLATVLLLAVSPGSSGAAEPPSCTGRTLATAAHQDDTLLFMSPRLQSELDSGRCLRTVFVTAGDAGQPASYWEGREAGVEAAYAELTGVANSWTTSSLVSAGHTLRLRTLSADPRVSIVFMRLPDGGMGGGFPAYGNQSIVKLWCSANPSAECTQTETEIEAVDKSAKYTYQGLLDTLSGLIGEFGPTQIWTQDYEEAVFATDHPDHVVTGRLTRAAAALDPDPHKLLAVWDYKTMEMPVNVSGTPLTRKQHAYYTYGAHDPLTCHTEAECEVGMYAEYGAWLKREYVRDERTHGVVADAGYGQTVTVGRQVTLDGSGSSTETGATPAYEWVQTGGPKVTLSNPAAAKPAFTMLGHPSLLTFRLIAKDGATTSPPDYVQVRVPSGTPDPTAVVAAGMTVDSGATVKLDGAESWDPNSLPLTYEWTQTAGPNVTLAEGTSATPEFLAPTGPATLTFSLVVFNGTQHSAAATVTYQVKGIAPSVSVPASASFEVGLVGSVSVKATGSPLASLSIEGALPAGVSFHDNGDGTATLAGTPSASVTPPGTSRGFPLTVTATNELGRADDQLTLTVVNPPEPEPEPEPEPQPTPPTPTPTPQPEPQPPVGEPVFAGPAVAYGFVGRNLDLPIDATGAPAISVTGELPAGLELRVDGPGQVRLVGKPKERGVHRVTLTARNSAGTATRQFRLVLEPLPELSARTLTLPAGSAGRRGVKITGPRIESVSCAGPLPEGIRCQVQGRRVSMTGTPAAGARGAYRLKLRIMAPAGTVVRPLTVRIYTPADG
jgi:LmbE family N-acetylglucosaminyl deacetylase